MITFKTHEQISFVTTKYTKLHAENFEIHDMCDEQQPSGYLKQDPREEK